jgi:hypothetical protein
VPHTEALRHPIHALDDQAHVLAEIERRGESGETVLVSIVRVMCVIVPVGAVMMVLAFGAAWLFG